MNFLAVLGVKSCATSLRFCRLENFSPESISSQKVAAVNGDGTKTSSSSDKVMPYVNFPLVGKHTLVADDAAHIREHNVGQRNGRSQAQPSSILIALKASTVTELVAV